MNIDGGSAGQITSTGNNDASCRSPDGTKPVFQSSGGSNVCVRGKKYFFRLTL